jgi:hypothetical protein
MIYFHLWHLAFFEASFLKLIYWESIQCETISWVIKSAIVYIITDPYWEYLRHMAIKLLFSDQLLVEHIVL